MARTSMDVAVSGGGAAVLDAVASILSKDGGNMGKQAGAAQISTYACN